MEALISAVLGSRGKILNQGRLERTFTLGQVRALWRRDRHCTFPDCDTPAAWCDAHHFVHGIDGVPTCPTSQVVSTSSFVWKVYDKTILDATGGELNDTELGAGRTCFIIGPIGDRLDPAGSPGKLRYEDAIQMWENVFEPACKTFSLAPVRADKIADSGEIPEQIFTYLRDADIVIADLTGGNANVMYELGLRHTRDKTTIQVGEHERLPFDVNTIRTVKFKRSEAGLIDARNGLIEALRAGLAGSGTPVTATRVWHSSADALRPDDIAAASARSMASDDPLDDEDNAPGSLEVLVAGEASLMSIGADLARVGEVFEELTAVAAEHTPALESAESFSARIPTVKRLADALKMPASRMEEASGDFFGNVQSVDDMMRLIALQVRENDEARNSAEFVDFRTNMVGLAASADEASTGVTETLGVMRAMRSWSSMLRPVSRSLEHSLNTILRGTSMVVEWAELLPPPDDPTSVE